MLRWLKELDEPLRGNKMKAELLKAGTRHLRLKPFVVLGVVLGVLYGLCMGLFAVLSRATPCWPQLLASAVKVPALFFLTLVVTFPSLYVFSALLGVRLGPGDTLRLLVAAIAVNLAVLASFGPITGFFTLSTTSYYFMKALNVAFFTVAGFIGLAFLLKALERLEEAQRPREEPRASGEAGAAAPAPPPPPAPWPPRPPEAPRAREVFRVWLILYALVGAQMGWILRPFILDPKLEFVWFRGREANIFTDLLRTLAKLLSGQ